MWDGWLWIATLMERRTILEEYASERDFSSGCRPQLWGLPPRSLWTVALTLRQRERCPGKSGHGVKIWRQIMKTYHVERDESVYFSEDGDRDRDRQRGKPKMCKHVLNAQVSIRAPCCKKLFECAECHAETTDHELKKLVELVVACKKCRKVFRIDSSDFDEETDSFCPNCDNQFYLFAKTPEDKGGIMIGFEGSVDMIRDDRTKGRMPTLHSDPRSAPAPLFSPPPSSSSSSSSSWSFKL